ncbi:MAG: signal peptide peptidase SppA [Deltaproteobacteria bacterium]|nr:signal peptide peptidase SppA [Deltaproteobacteria bacterium]
MIKCGALRNILAAFGAVVACVIALAIVIGIVSGGGVTGDKVAVVDIQGVIADPYEINTTLRELGERDDVKAVVLRIESPGGAVGPSQEIHGEILRLKEKKTVVASMGAIAASGGYYAAVAADKIMANPGTITGSIGVIVEFVNAQELLGKIGLKGYVVKSGKYKDVGSPLREMEKEERELLQTLINDVNGQFIKAVAEGRGLKTEEVRRIADGRIFTGAQAKQLKLVDELGGLSDAIALSASLAGIEGEPSVLYPERQKMSIWKTFSGGASIESLTELFTGLRVMYMIQNPAR